MTLGRDDARRSMRLIVEDRRQPTLALVDRPLFPLRIVFDLIAFDFSHTEICALRMAEVEAADRCSGPHCEALRQSYADTLAVEQPEQHRSEEHTSELQSLRHLVCRLLLEKKKRHSAARLVL